MKPTKTIAYALACIRELSKRMGEFVQVSEIAAAQNVPAAYCQKILLALSKAGIVLSVKGQGFCLLLQPESISTLRVLQALQENSSNDYNENESIRMITHSLSTKLNSTLERLTVAEILVGAR